MKNTIACLLIVVCGLKFSAQPSPKKDPSSLLWGFADANDNWVIPAQYLSADSFQNGLARVSNQYEQYGLIDEQNDVIVPLTHAYVGPVIDGLLHAQDASTSLYGYYSSTGTLVVPYQFEMANNFNSGLAGVRLDNMWGFIDKSGKMVITPQFDGIVDNSDDDWMGDYSFDFDLGYNFSSNYCIVTKNGLDGIIDKTGKVILDFTFSSLQLTYDENSIIAEKCEGANINCRFGVIDMSGKTIVKFEYSGIDYNSGFYKLYQGSTQSAFFGTQTGGVIGFANQDGKIIVPCMYDNEGDHTFENMGYAFTNQRYRGAGVYEGIVLVCLNNLWGYLDANGNEIIPFQFEEASAFARDSAEVTLNGHKFIINKQGRCIQNCPDDLSLMTPEKLADQSGNYDYLLNTFMKFYIDDFTNYAGEELNTRRINLYEENKQKLDMLIAHGNTQQKAWARHLKFAIVKEISTAISIKSCQDGLVYMRQIRPLASQISSSDYPILFDYNGNEREYRFEDFDALYWKYYTTLAECEYLSKDPLAIEDLKIALSHETNNFNKALFYGYLIDFKQSVKQYDIEMLEYSNLMLEKYVGLSEEEKKKLNDHKLWTGNQPAAVEAAFTSKTSERIPSDFYLKAYPFYEQLGETENSRYFMEKLYKSGYDDYTFLWNMAETKKSQSDYDEAGQIAEKLSIKTSIADCANLQRLAEFYMAIDKTTEAKEMKAKADECTKSSQKAAEKIARDETRRSKRSYSSYDVNPGVYFGVDLFPLMSTVKGHRDFGFCMDIVGRRAAHEFYYEKINVNKDQLFDLSNGETETDGYDVRWSGYQAAYAFKGYMNDDRNVQYFGVNLRYRSKTFEPVTSFVMDETNTIIQAEKLYNPTEKQIEMLLNWGVMTTRRGIACDMYFGFGPKYSIFSHNIQDYKAEDIYSHVMLENRKETRWGIGMRIGLTIGLKL
ncbi:MAG: WG repeat-containing protein [Flavobacteriales bacterium]